jgi:hypothetical protein
MNHEWFCKGMQEGSKARLFYVFFATARLCVRDKAGLGENGNAGKTRWECSQ